MKNILMILAISFAFFSCEANNNDNTKLLQPIILKGNNWAEKLGYPKNSRVTVSYTHLTLPTTPYV